MVVINGDYGETSATAYALSVVGEALKEEGISLEIIHIGNTDIAFGGKNVEENEE